MTRNEEKVFFASSNIPESVSSLALKAKVPRTSAEKALKRLEKLGLIVGRKIREKNKHVYLKADAKNIDLLLEDVRSKLLDKEGVQKTGITISNTHKVSVFSGKKGIIESIENMLLSMKANERMCVIQGSDAVKAWVRYLGEDHVLKIHSIVNKNKLIIVSLRSSDLKKEMLYNEKVKGSFKGRLTQAHSIPDEFFQESLSIYIYRDTLLLIDLQAEIAFEIVDKLISKGFLKLVNFILTKTNRDAVVF